MKNTKLTKEEKEILKSFERGEFQRVKNYKNFVSQYKRYAKETLNKTKNVNIPLLEKDLQKIKAKAIEEGVPYQIFIASLIHKYIKGKVKIL